jgi:hypothetical protein
MAGIAFNIRMALGHSSSATFMDGDFQKKSSPARFSIYAVVKGTEIT